jgi:hypothetical protein
MNAESFAYWLQGFVEMNPESMPTEAQWKMIKEHLQTVFHKVTPPLNQPGLRLYDNEQKQWIWQGPYISPFDNGKVIC